METTLNEKKRATDILISRVEKVYEEFQFILGSSRLDITIKMKTTIDELISTSTQLEDATTDAWIIANRIGTIDDDFEKLVEVIASIDLNTVSTSASHTYVLTTISDINSFLQYHRLFAANEVNQRIYNLLLSKVSSDKIEVAEQKYIEFPHAAIMFAQYLQSALDRLSGPDQAPYIHALERTKTRALSANADEKSHISWHLQRFGLVPIKQHMTPSELIKFYFDASVVSGGKKMHVDKSSGIEEFIAACKLKKVNVLVISAITQSPIEYDVSTLMETTPGVDSSVGVSIPVLKKFNTVYKNIAYDKNGHVTPPKHIGFSVVRHVLSVTNTKYVIVRTLDGITWAAMRSSSTLERSEDNVSSNFSDAFLVDKIIRGSSSRINTYQKIKNAEFTKFVMVAPEMGESIKKSNKGLIQDLVNRITGRIIQYIDTSLVPLPTDPLGLETAISDPRFVEIMTNEFLKSYKECGVDSNRPADEFLGTFIADFETSIAIQFSRNIKLNMIELGPDAIVFRDYHGETLRTRLYNLFVDVIKRSITGSIMTKENIYEKILIKDHLLGILATQLSKAEQK